VACVLNNTVLSNFAKVSRTDLLGRVLGRFYITEEVLSEYRKGIERRGLPELKTKFEVIRLSEEERRFAETLMRKLGKGEASSIAVAKFRTLKFFSDDIDARREAMKLGLEVHGTITVLVLCVKKGVLSLEEANALLNKMIECGYYSPIRDLRNVLEAE